MTILQMSLGGAVLIAAILVLRRALLYRIPKWAFLLLWAVALGRLLIPFALPSRFSVYTGAARGGQLLEPDAPATPSEARPPAADPGTFQGDSWTAPAIPADPVPALERRPVSPVTIVYLAGSALCAAFFAAAYLRALRRFSGAQPVTSGFLSRWQAEHPALLPVEIRSCAAVSAPLAYGLLRPVILLPQNTDWSDEDQLTCVLTHEYVHIRRGDLGWKLLLTAALCLHWFNPFVWAMYFQANRDLELACDEAVIRILGLDSRKRYACALLSAAESGFSPFCITFTTKNHMEERIRAIMKIKRASVAAILAAALLVTGVTAVFATSRAAEPKDHKTLPQAVQGQALPQPDPTPAPAGKDDSAPDASAPAVTLRPAPAQAPDVSGPAATLQPAPTQTPEPAAKPVSPAVEPVEVDPEPVQPEPTALENRWGIPDGEIPQGSEFTAAGFEDARELGKYLEAVHGLCPGDYTADRTGGTVSVQVHYREKMIREHLPDGTYPVNSRGETYGSISAYEVVGYKPDLISVVATNGATGYVLRSDMENTGYPGPTETPEDMAAYTEWLEAQPGPRLIPVYDVNRDNVVGDFSIGH